MVKDKAFYCCIIFISLFLTGCGFNKNTGKDMNYFLNADKKTLADLSEDYSLLKRSNKFQLNGIDTAYNDMTGIVNVLNIYTEMKETKITITYNSQISSGNVRIILIKSNREVVDIVKNNGNGTINEKISGRTIIKCIAKDATGNLKIGVNFGDTLLGGEFKQDGIFTFNKSSISNDTLKGAIYHLKVVNKKIDKIAKIEISGKLVNNRTVVQFDDDGWGNSGTVECGIQKDGKLYFNVRITNRKSKSAEWGFKEGNFITNDEPLPSYTNGL